MRRLFARVKGMAVNPAQEWQKIAREPIELGPVLTRYVAILAAIPLVPFVPFVLVELWYGYSDGLVHVLVRYVLTIIGVVVNAKLVELLATEFGIPSDADAALKLAVFAPTVVWVAGVLSIIPGLGPVVALAAAFYAIYTLYLGVPIVMQVPQHRKLTFTLSVIGAAILVDITVRALIERIA